MQNDTHKAFTDLSTARKHIVTHRHRSVYDIVHQIHGNAEARNAEY